MQKTVFFGLYCVNVVVLHVMIFGLKLLLFADLKINENSACPFNVFNVLKEVLVDIQTSLFSFLNPLMAITISVKPDGFCLFSQVRNNGL